MEKISEHYMAILAIALKIDKYLFINLCTFIASDNPNIIKLDSIGGHKIAIFNTDSIIKIVFIDPTRQTNPEGIAFQMTEEGYEMVLEKLNAGVFG